ncbi:phosphatidylinositol transfer protein SFH5 [Cryomyces antarcticus]
MELTEKGDASVSDFNPPAAANGVTHSTADDTHSTANAPSNTPQRWPDLTPEHPLAQFIAMLPGVLEEADYSEVYGVALSCSASDASFHTKLVLQKFLRANSDDIPQARTQLLETLKWRKSYQPLLAMDEVHSGTRFRGLGYVMRLSDVPDSVNAEDVATFNIYGAVKDTKRTFGDIDAFLRWRIALMELGLSRLHLSTATRPIPDFGHGADPYQGIQIHDYLNVTFLFQPAETKAATKRTIEIFTKYYPETLSRKYFVNVPRVMQWMFAVVRPMLARETVKKFNVLSYGDQLVGELGTSVPEVYGGKGGSLESVGEGLKMKEG